MASEDRTESFGRTGVRGRILLVEDESSFGDAFRRVLQAENEVTVVDRAKTAIDLVQRGERYDVIFVDVMMLRMNGIDFVKRLNLSHPEQAARVVLVRSGFCPSYIHEGLARLPNACLEKPIDLRDLRSFVRRRVCAPLAGESGRTVAPARGAGESSSES